MYAFTCWGRTTHLFQDSNILKFPNNFPWKTASFRLVFTIFFKVFIFHQMIALQKLWKMFLISSKKLFSLFRYLKFCIFLFPCFFLVSHCFRGWSNKNLKIYDVINCLNKIVTLFRMEEGVKSPLYPFFPCNFYKCRN